MKKTLAKTFIFLTLLGAPSLALAQAPSVGTDLGNVSNIGQYLSNFFRWGVPIMGSLAVLMFIYAGYLYMTSSGTNTENINLAKEIITATILGILLLFTVEILMQHVLGTV